MSTSEKTDGGPAFPCDVFDPDVRGPEQWEGMSLRDYFAAKAMAAMIGMDGATIGGERLAVPAHSAIIATASYAMADAMLEARAAASIAEQAGKGE